MKKLGQLALVQEGMKGFPDGIPDIALPLFGSDIAQSQPMQQPSQEQPVARYGGLPKHQSKGQVFDKRRDPFQPSIFPPLQTAGQEKQAIHDKELNDRYEFYKLMKRHPHTNEFSVPESFSWMNPATVIGGAYAAEKLLYPLIKDVKFIEGIGALPEELLARTIPKTTLKARAIADQISEYYQATTKLQKLKYLMPGITTFGTAAGYIANEVGKYNNWWGNQDIDDIHTPESTPAPGAVLIKNNVYQQQAAAQAAAQQTKKVVSQPPVNTTSSTTAKAKVTNTAPSTKQETNVTIGDPNSNWGEEPSEKKLGGSLQEFQSKGQFDIRDQSLQDAAKTAGASLTRPNYFPYWENIGAQSPSKNPKDYTRNSEGVIIPTKGAWQNPKTQKSYSSIQDFVDYANPYVNFEDYDTQTNDKQKGIDLWKKNIAGSSAEREKAGRWFVDRTNTYNKSILGKSAPNTIDPNVTGFWEPGSEFMNVQFAKKLPASAPAGTSDAETSDAGTAAKTTMEDVGETKYETGVEQTPWWNYDEVNYANQLGNYASIEPGNLPPYQQYNPYLARPTFVDPARAIAQQQGLVRGSQEAIMSGASPTAGRANVIAAQAAAAPQVANIMAQYDQSNVGIANQYGQQNAQTMNQAQMQNMQLKKQYADELEVRRQQYVNALREGRTDVAKSIMQGMKNAAETGWQNAQSDSYSVDPRSGNVYFKRGFDPKTGAYRLNNSNERDVEYVDYLVEKKGWDREDAIRYITGKKYKKGADEAQYGGMFNPMELIWNS